MTTKRKVPGKRGPKPGAQRLAAEARRAAALAAIAPPKQPILLLTGPPLTPAQRENPRYLGGEALQQLAHRWGMSKTSLKGLPDAKIREQLRFITQRRIDEGV